MVEARSVTTFLAGQFKLSSKQCSQSSEDKEMSQVPYTSEVRLLVYAMVCTRPDLAYAISIISRFISNSGKQY